MRDMAKILIALVRSAVKAEPLSEKIISQITPEILEKLYKLSNHLDVTQFASDTLYKNGLLSNETEVGEMFKAAQLSALIRYTRLKLEQKRIYKIFSDENILFIPLKGDVVRKYYNEPYMRTSCDIDILVREEDLNRATKLLEEKLKYSADKKAYHDISLFSPDGVHLELHFNVLEHLENIDTLLEKVWDYAVPSGNSSEYMLTNEFLMFYLVAHAMYHFINGGCGIKPFVDIYVLKGKMLVDDDLLHKMCEECGILTFYQKCCDLIDVWFGNKEHDNVTLDMEKFVISGGTYGTLSNKLAVERTEVSNSMEYLLKRIFMKKSDLQIIYPQLKQYSALFPYYTVKRWAGLLNKSKQRRIFWELKTNSCITEKEISYASDLMAKLGLDF